MDVIAWLLDGDPAIRYQTLRDLTAADTGDLAAARTRIAREGIAQEILAHQDADGVWRCADEPDWLPTLFHAVLLRRTDIDPADARDSIERLQAGFRWAEEFGALPFCDGEAEPCINGHALSVGSYFGHPSERLVQRLLADQLADGGWNCDAPSSTVASYHSTICAADPRLADAIALLEERRQPDGTWLLDRSHPDALAFRWPESVGEPSRWNTLRALRVLRWARG